MILSLDQYHALNNVSSRSMGYKLDEPYGQGTIKLWSGAVDGVEHKWGKCAGDNRCVGVPYHNNGFNTKQMEKIRLAMDEVELNTCIR